MILRLAIILMIITSIAAGGLALLNTKTAPIIAEIKRVEQEQARKEVIASLGDSIRFEEIIAPDGFTYWKAFNEAGEHVGYAALAFGKGYSSTIETVCGFDTEFNVAGLKITFQQETPGLGTKIQEIKSGEDEPWFQRQFKGIAALTAAVVQDRGTIDSVTGATISSRAVAKSVSEAATLVQAAAAAAPESPEFTDDIDDDGYSELNEEGEPEYGMDRDYSDEEADLESYVDEEAE